MESSSGTRDLLPQADKYRQTWIAFFRANCDTLFQTALLLSADPDTAEAGIAASIDSVDLSRAPEVDELAAMQETVVRQTIQSIRPVAPSQIAKAQSMLQSGLWPVLHMEESPRACFVLRMLLGYAMSTCAQILGMEEAGVRTLLRLAILQLHDAVIGKDCVEASFDGSLSSHSDTTGHLPQPTMSVASVTKWLLGRE